MLELSVACLAYVLHGEAQTLSQKIAVGSVVINSAKSIDKICDEVYKPHRYEYITLIQQGKAKEPNQKQFLENKLIALDLIRKKYYIKDYHHFHDDRIHNPWNFKPKEKIGTLTFY